MRAIDSISRDLSEPRSTPHLVFFIKGEKHAGKSTLMNALFCRNFIRRPEGVEEPQAVTVCNDETGQPTVKYEYRNIRVGHSILDGLFSVNRKVEYTFIDTTSATREWFETNTKLCNAVILVVDKDKLSCDLSRQQLLDSTLHDLAEVYKSTGFTLPLIIIVNKVDDCDDTEDLERIKEFQRFVSDTVKRSDHSDQSVGFAFMSALDAYLYRTFTLTGTFERFDTRDVLRLCGMELGAEGKAQAREHKNYPELEEALRGRALSETGNQRWKLHCGVDRLMATFDELILAEQCMFCMLEKQVSLHLELFSNPSLSSNCSSIARNIWSFPVARKSLAIVTQTPPRNTKCSADKWLMQMRNALDIHNQYASVFSCDPNDATCFSYRQRICQFCKERYRECLDGYIEAVFLSTENMTCVSDSIVMLVKHEQSTESMTCASDLIRELVKHEQRDFENLFSAEDWEEIRSQSMLHIIKLVWTGILRDGVSSVSESASFGHERIVNAAHVTIGMMKSGMKFPTMKKVIQSILAPFIAEMSTAIAIARMNGNGEVIDLADSSSEDERRPAFLPIRFGQGGREDTVLTYLEKVILSAISVEGCSEAKMAFLDAMIRKKISIRQHIAGYTVCLRELLNNYRSAREKFFSLFFPVLHEPIPLCDMEWGTKLPRELNYKTDILGNSLLTSETVLVESICSGQALSSSAQSCDATEHTVPNQLHSNGSTTTESSLPKRRRMNSPQTVHNDDSPSTYSSEPNTQSRRTATPSRMRIIRKFGEC